MKKSYLDDYTLLLIKDDEILYKSQKKWLYPTWECINKFGGRISDCILYDRIIGLAAAKLISHSGIASEIYSPKVSRDAIGFLQDSMIELTFENEFKYIEKEPGAGRCKAEEIALKMKPDEFYEYMKTNFFN